ncbi:PD-(D/E)XK nuclease family protein [Flavobacterium aciduliphilum]|uniref:PD-(D/E)XK nuclease superfamily protein n=1 Tax=Flavobacterium aciduliphilum TaxID=1101402 RepID=A0A328YJR6_9FLAO|nr:PD-(D/E)XK nuclease family protein [Flavobacterium aciduliphilum]RAR73780.1 PD-(D/E)XK nuclease superfamily protein [Flavobacterium aciduliphilum]
MNQIITNLKTNFLFQMSLSSKELFHSNMLAWLMEQKIDHDLLIAKIFIESITNQKIIGPIEKIVVKREELNIDLIIEYDIAGVRNYIFIENKMKSIPKPEQLEEYDKKIDGYILNNKIKNKTIVHHQIPYKKLLIPSEIFINVNWEVITYKKHIINILVELQQRLNSNNKNNKELYWIISKYHDFLINIISIFEFYLGDDFENKPYNFYSQEFDKIREIRLHDMLLKNVHERISMILKNRLTKENIIVSSDFTRSTGISDVFITLTNEFKMGLQIQGNTLKYFLCCDKSDNLSKKNIAICKQLVEKKLWFYDNFANPITLLSGNGRNKTELQINETTTFCEYDKGHFIYLTKSISEYKNKTIRDLIEYIVSEINNAIGKKQDIVNLINQI